MITIAFQCHHACGSSVLLCAKSYSCSPPLPLPRPPKYCGLRLAVSNTPVVINTPAISKACATALTPKTVTDPTDIPKIIHHIHASTCITMCRVLLSGMRDSGLYLLSMISLYDLSILVIFKFTTCVIVSNQQCGNLWE